MKSHVSKGLDFIDAGFTLQTFNVKDHINEAKRFPYIVETYIPKSQQLVKFFTQKSLGAVLKTLKTQSRLDSEDKLDDKNALNIKFSSNARKMEGNSSLKLVLKSDAQLFLFLNLKSLLEVQVMLASAFAKHG